MTPGSVFSPYGGRRFLMTLGCAGICTALLVNGYLSDIVFRDIIIGTVAVYIAGNTAQKLRGKETPDDPA